MTELVFILDRSGSMRGMEADTIGGFNSMIEKQKKEEGEALVTTVLFDTHHRMIHDRVPLKDVPELTEREYSVRGCTALLDTVGHMIRHISTIHRYARPEDRPEKTLFVITTDGMENTSRRYSYERVRQMITHEQEKYGWEFVFLGADIDVAKEARRMGIRPDRAVSYRKDRAGVGRQYDMVSDVVYAVRACADLNVPLERFAADERNR